MTLAEKGYMLREGSLCGSLPRSHGKPSKRPIASEIVGCCFYLNEIWPGRKHLATTEPVVIIHYTYALGTNCLEGTQTPRLWPWTLQHHQFTDSDIVLSPYHFGNVGYLLIFVSASHMLRTTLLITLLPATSM